MARLLVPEWKNIRSERVRNYETYLFVVKGELGDPMLAIRPEPNAAATDIVYDDPTPQEVEDVDGFMFANPNVPDVYR